MIHGHFDVRTFETPGLTEEGLSDLIGPREDRGPGAIDKLLDQWTPVQRSVGKNLIMDSFAAIVNYWMFQASLSKLDITDPLDFNGAGGMSPWSSIIWETTDTEPTYQEFASIFADINSTSGTVGGGSPGKRFISDDVEDHLISSDPDGREAINFRSRWLWLPGDFNSNNIRSIAAWFCQDGGQTYGTWRARVSRIRLKDSAGNPIIINKTANQSLFAEYNVTLITV